MKSRKISVKDITYTALFTALIIISTFIIIPTPFVPITLQVAVVLLSGVILGSKLSFMSNFMYLLLGLIGLPIFSGGSGGIMSVFKPTFGYIIGFIFAAFAVGYLTEKVLKNINFKNIFIVSLIGVVIIYIFGVTYFYFVMNYYLNQLVSVNYVLINMILITLPVDILKCFLVGYIGSKVRINVDNMG